MGGLATPSSHNRMSSLDSTTSEESSIPTPHFHGSVSSLISGRENLKDHYGSITSLASSTSMISPQELQNLIDEANQSLEESGTPSHEIMVIVLHREYTQDGRIQKGDRVLSINGRSTKGVSHREALSILKAPRAEVVLVLSRSRSVTPAEGAYDRTDYPSYNYLNSGRPPKILESPLDSKSLMADLKFVDVPGSVNHGDPEEGGHRSWLQSRGRKGFSLWGSTNDSQEDIHRRRRRQKRSSTSW